MKKSLAKNAVFNIVYRGLNVLFPLISATYVARILSAGGLGAVGYAQNIESYFVMVAMLGLPTYGTREIARCGDDQNKLNKTFSELFIINVLSTAICVVAYFCVIPFFSAEQRTLLRICGIGLCFNFINVDWFYTGREDYVYIAIRSSLVKIFSIICMLAFVRDQQDCEVYALIVCLANGSNYIFNILRLRKEVKFVFRNLSFKKHMKPLIGLLFCSIALNLYHKIDVTMLGSISGNVSVGIYNSSFKTINLAIGVVAASTSIFLPRISYYYQTDRKKYDECVTLGVKIVSFISIPATIGMALVSEELVAVLFGEAFREGHTVIQILSPILVIRGVGDILCYQVLVSSGKENRFLIAYSLAAVSNIVLNSLLIPRIGYNGAAIASVICEFVVNATLLVFALQEIRPKVSITFVMSVICSSLCMVVVVRLIQRVFDTEVFSLLFSVIFGGMIYLALNIVLKNDVVKMVLHKLRSRRRAC